MPEASYDCILLVDHLVDAGIDEGGVTIITSPDELTAGTKQHDFATVFFGQKRKPRQLILCRVVNASAEINYGMALNEARRNGTSFWGVAQIGATEEQILYLSTQIETKQEFLVIASDDSDIPTASSTDLASLLKGRDRTMCIYTEYPDTDIEHYVDAAVLGTILPTVYASQAVGFAWQELKLVADSGATGPLSSVERTRIEGKNCCHIEALASYVMCRKGVSCNGIPAVMLLHMDKMTNDMQSAIFSFMLNSDYPSFSDTTIGALEGIIKTHVRSAVQKGLLVDTVDDPIQYNFPSQGDFTAGQKAAGTLNLTNCWIAKMNYPVLDIVCYGTWTI
jgi:hypothetical protein